MPNANSAALTTSYVVIRILMIANWLYGGVVLAILIGMIVAERWTMTALGFAPSQSVPLIWGLRAIPALGLVAVPLNVAMLTRLAAMVETVRAGDPFVAQNAYRLQAIGWLLLAEQLLSILIGVVSEAVSTPAQPLHLDAGFSPAAWLAVILIFVLARVFAEGTLMREDLEGTV